MGFLSSIVIVASVTITQADKPADPHLQQLAPLVGTWTVDLDLPNFPIKRATVTTKWILGGRYLESRWRKMDGTDLGPEIFTWDPVDNIIKMWGFDSDTFYESMWQIEGTKWTGKYSGTGFVGQRSKSTIVLEFEGDSTIILKAFADGSDEATGSGRFTKAKTGPVERPAQQQLNDWAEDFAGEWFNESVAEEDMGPVKKGDKFDAFHSYTWSPDKEALYLTYSAEFHGQVFDTTKGVAGWDAVRKGVVVRWFDSLGSTGELVFTKKGQNWHYTWASTDAEGGKFSWKGTITFGPGVQRVHDADRMIKGVASPDLHLTWKRKS